jgi:hypothetical protein
MHWCDRPVVVRLSFSNDDDDDAEVAHLSRQKVVPLSADVVDEFIIFAKRNDLF